MAKHLWWILFADVIGRRQGHSFYAAVSYTSGHMRDSADASGMHGFCQHLGHISQPLHVPLYSALLLFALMVWTGILQWVLSWFAK
jgi:hypothetical protein